MVSTENGSRIIEGAILQISGASRPYAQSRPLRVAQLELSPPGPGEILVRIEAAGICHSDLSVVNGDRPRPLPMLLGHEAAGIVEQVGDGVDDVPLGTRVVMTFLPRCGDCRGCRSDGRIPCENGSRTNGEGTLLAGTRHLSENGETVQHHLGVSAFATHAVVARNSVVPVSDDVPAEVAALLGCAVLTGGGALLNAARPGPDDAIAIIGLGGVGMAALAVAVAIGAQRIIGIDANGGKLDRARELGATEVYLPDEALAAGIRPDVVVEAAGNARAFELAVKIVAPGGTAVTVGLPAPDAMSTISPLAMTAEAKTVMGSYLGSAVPSRDIPIYEGMWRDGRLDVAGLVSSYVQLSDINEAMDTLAAGDALRQVILFTDKEQPR